MNINAYIDDILTPALREMKKHFKNKEFLSFQKLFLKFKNKHF